jgi:general nucleoside transport system permease protein
LRLEKREVTSALAVTVAPFAALCMTGLVAMLLVLWAGAPIDQTFSAMLEGSLGSRFAISETLTRATPLIFTGLAAAISFRAKFYNIGAEGQLYAGALAAVGFASLTSSESAPLMVLAGCAAGALLLLGPAWLKERFGVDEVVVTLLLNFIALLFVSWMLDGPMKDPTAMGWPQSIALPPELEFSKLMERSRVHTGLWIAIALAIALELMVRYTRFGFSLRATGLNPQAARFLGIPITRTILLVAIISGALAGMAGVSEVAGRTGYVTLDMSPGYGYTGIVIAMLAGLSPLGVVAAAVFVAAIIVGADSMSRVVGVPTYIADVLVAVALLSMLVSVLLTQYQFVKTKRS